MGHLISILFPLSENETTCIWKFLPRNRDITITFEMLSSKNFAEDQKLVKIEQGGEEEDSKKKALQSLTEHTVSIKKISKLVEKNQEVSQNNMHAYTSATS